MTFEYTDFRAVYGTLIYEGFWRHDTLLLAISCNFQPHMWIIRLMWCSLATVSEEEEEEEAG